MVLYITNRSENEEPTQAHAVSARDSGSFQFIPFPGMHPSVSAAHLGEQGREP